MLRFFPAAGERNRGTGSARDRASTGLYWSQSASSSTYAWLLFFSSSEVRLIGEGPRSNAYPIRCVAQWKFRNYMLLLTVFCIFDRSSR